MVKGNDLPDNSENSVAATVARPGAEVRPVVKSNVPSHPASSKKGVVEAAAQSGAETAAQSGTEDRPVLKSDVFALPDRSKKGMEQEAVE